MKFTKQDLKNYMEMCSSVFRIIGNTIIYKKRAILDGSGKPVSVKQFKSVVDTPEKLVIREPISHEIFQKTPKEKALLKATKKDYSDNMKALLGNNWKKLSNSMQIYNVPDDKKIVTQIQSQL